MKYQLLITLLLGLALRTSSAGATDISGAWTLAFFPGDKPINTTFVFKQEGEKLSGTYSGPFGEHQVNGTVKGDKVVFGFEVKGPGSKGSVTATFTGVIDSPTKMTGTVGNPFCGDEGCKWTATKRKR
jgi:hypothetical protein